MKQPKTVYLVFGLLGVVILIILVQVFKVSEKPTPAQNKIVNPPEVVQFIPPAKFKITSTNISSQSIEVNEVVKFAFDRSVNNESLSLEIKPQEDILPLFDPSLTELTIKPINAWNFNTRYTVKILKSTMSQDKQPLDQDYEFSFQSKPYIGI